MEDILENKLICRICLKVVDQTKQSYGNIEDDTGTLRDMMLCCIPEMDIYVSSNPILCFPCIQALVGLYNFKTKCINTETIIKTYMNRHNINEFGNVNLTYVVKDLIQINTVQKQIQDQKAAMVKQNKVITESEPNRTTEVVNDTRDNTPTEHSLQQEEAIPPLQEISTNNVSQVSQKVSEENDSCPAKDEVVNISSNVPEVSRDKTLFEKTPLDPHNQPSSLSLNTDSKLLLNFKRYTSPSGSHPNVTFSTIAQTSLNESQNTKATISCFGEISVPNLETPNQVLETSELSTEVSKDKSENNLSIPVSVEETPTILSQPTKPNNALHRPFFDNSIPTIISTSSSDTSKSNSEVLQTFSQAPSYSIPQQNLTDHLPSKSNSPILRRSSSSLTHSDISMSDHKEFDILSPQFEHQTTSSPPELKNLDSEISQIIDQLGNDLDKEGNNFFSHVGNQPPHESQSNQSSRVLQENLHPSMNHHNETNQFPETSRHANYSAHISNRPLSQMGYHPTQMASSRVHYSSADLRQFASQTNLNSLHITQNSAQMSHCSSHSSDRMGMTSHLPMNRSELGPFPQHIPQIQHLSQMGAHSSQMGQHSSQMGQHLSQIGQTSYQIRPHLSQMGHSSQTPNSEMGYHQQMVRHPSHINPHYSQLSSQFPNISNHLRNGPQMGYVSSNMANALAQIGQVPSEYNQMSQQMKYLRMQLQIRHGFSPMGPIPPQFGNRQSQIDGRPSQVRHWLPSSEHDSSQGKFNSGHGQIAHDTSHYRAPQLPYSHVGYGHSQMNQGMGHLPQHMNPQHSQINQGSSQYSHSQGTQQPPNFSQMHYYLNRGPQHFNRSSQSPSLSEMPQRSMQRTPTPPSRSPLNFLHSQNRSGVFSPSNYDTFSSSESILSNNEVKKSNSPLNTCKSPDVGRYGEKDNWKINHFNFRTSNSPLSRFVSSPINSQMRMPSQNIPIVPPNFGVAGFHHMGMPPPQTNFLPKDHLAQRLRLNSRVENLQSDNYHSTSDESINSLLVDLPPIEAPVVPLSVQIKSLGTLESIQQPPKESQEPSEVLSSVSDNVLRENKEITETEVHNESESAGMKESYNFDEKKTSDKPTEISESEVVTISKDDIYREVNEDSLKNSTGQDECSPEESLQKSSVEKMDIDPIVLVNHPNPNKLSQEPASNKIFSMNYQCFNCTFVTDSSEGFISHREACKEVKEKVEHKCPHCPYVTTRRYVLTQHINSQHTKEIWYQCLDCDYKCTDKSYLKKHSKIHVEGSELEEKVCEYCDFRTLSEYNYRKHLSKHDIQVLQCEFCSYSTNDRTNFRRHLFTHNPVPSDCDFCDYKSVSPYHMRNHLKKYHNGVGVEDLDLRKDQPIMELVDQIRAAVKDANQISLGLYKV